jgi:hypothetical protein
MQREARLAAPNVGSSTVPTVGELMREMATVQAELDRSSRSGNHGGESAALERKELEERLAELKKRAFGAK